MNHKRIDSLPFTTFSTFEHVLSDGSLYHGKTLPECNTVFSKEDFQIGDIDLSDIDLGVFLNIVHKDISSGVAGQVLGYLKSKYLSNDKDSEKWLLNIKDSINHQVDRFNSSERSREMVNYYGAPPQRIDGAIDEIMIKVNEFLIPIEASLNAKMKSSNSDYSESTRVIDSPKG